MYGKKKDKHVIGLGIYTVMVINIYIVKKNFKTKVNSPRKWENVMSIWFAEEQIQMVNKHEQML